MKNHDHPAALVIHVDLTRGSLTDDISLWNLDVWNQATDLTTVKEGIQHSNY
jgi:hypothetical protein